MSELIIRPTAKYIKAGFGAAFLVAVGLDILLWPYAESGNRWLLAVPALLLAWPAARWMQRQCTKAVISGDRLRYETGVLSRSTRNIQLSKIQDVRVDQRLGERLMNVGDLSIETAGETSRLAIPNVDQPQALAEELMNRVQKGPVTPQA